MPFHNAFSSCSRLGCYDIYNMLLCRFRLEEHGAHKAIWLFTLWSEVIQLFCVDHIISLECLSFLCFGDDWTFLTVWDLMMDTDLSTEVR